MGEWNDHADRHVLTARWLQRTTVDMTRLMSRSLNSAETVLLREPKTAAPVRKSSSYADLVESMLSAARTFQD